MINGQEATPKKSRRTGRVKWYNVVLGYGFITDNNGNDIFVPRGSIKAWNRNHRVPSLKEGETVEFKVKGTSRPWAVEVTGPRGTPVCGSPLAIPRQPSTRGDAPREEAKPEPKPRRTTIPPRTSKPETSVGDPPFQGPATNEEQGNGRPLSPRGTGQRTPPCPSSTSAPATPPTTSA